MKNVGMLEYIENKLVKRDNSYENLEQLQKIVEIFNINEVDIEFYINLIDKSNKLFDILKSIVDDSKLLKQILSEDNSIIVNFIEAYASIVKLNLYDEDYKVNDVFFDDNVKQYLLDASKNALLTEEKEKNYFEKLRMGFVEYRDKIILSNLKLVVSIARRYIGRGLSFDDLIQEGNIGLMEAIDKFDLSKCCKFSTYATYCIRQKISRAVMNNGRNIRIPVHMLEKIRKFNKIYDEYILKNNKEPSIKDLTILLEENEETIRLIYSYRMDSVSLNSKLSDDSEDELEKYISDETVSVEDTVIKSILSDDIKKYLEVLNEKQRIVIISRYGLDGDNPKTLEEIGKNLTLTRERIRQIEKSALKKLRFAITSKNVNNVKSVIDNNIFEYLDVSKSKENIIILKDAIKELSLIERKKLKIVFGDNYLFAANVKLLNNIEKEYLFSNVIPRLKDIFNKIKNESIVKRDFIKDNIEDKKPNNTEVFGDMIADKRIKSTRKIKTIYEHFVGYNRDEIDEEIQNLNDNDKSIIYMKYGNDLTKPVTSEVWYNNTKKNTIYLTNLFQKMKKRMDNNRKSIISDQENCLIKQSNDCESEIIKDVNVENNSKHDSENNVNNYNKVTFEQLEKIYLLRKLKDINYDILRNYVNEEEAIIISLKLGIGDKTFTTSQIANFFGKTESEVIDINKKVLVILKEIINRTIDNTIDYLISNEISNVIKEKKLNNR